MTFASSSASSTATGQNRRCVVTVFQRRLTTVFIDVCPSHSRWSHDAVGVQHRNRWPVSATSARSRSTTILWLSRSTSSSSAEMKSTAIPPSDSSATSRWISALAPTSMPRVGSSRISSRGSVISHRASSTFCWLPPLRFRDGDVRIGRRDVAARRCTWPPARRACRRGSGRAQPRTRLHARE